MTPHARTIIFDDRTGFPQEYRGEHRFLTYEAAGSYKWECACDGRYRIGKEWFSTEHAARQAWVAHVKRAATKGGMGAKT